MGTHRGHVCLHVGVEAGGWGEAGTFITLKFIIQGEMLSEKLYIYVYTHIHIYTYTQVTTYEYLVVKKYRLFYNNSTIDFYYNTQ